MAFIRLVPHAYVFTPYGVAEVHFLETPDGFETNATWMCMQVETKEWWQWPTPMVRGCESISGMRDTSYSPFGITDAYFETLRPHILRHKLSPLYERAAKASPTCPLCRKPIVDGEKTVEFNGRVHAACYGNMFL